MTSKDSFPCPLCRHEMHYHSESGRCLVTVPQADRDKPARQCECDLKELTS